MVTIAIEFDDNKVTQCLQVDHAHKEIVGGVLTYKSIDVGNKTV